MSDERRAKRRRSESPNEQVPKEREALLEKFGYTDESNPFHDPELSKPFVWDKKFGNKAQKLDSHELARQSEQTMTEIDRVRQRRGERDREEKRLEEQRSRKVADRSVQSYEEWKLVEDKFHRGVAIQRSRIRIRERREDIIDWLLKELDIARGFDFPDMRLYPVAPEEIFKGLEVAKIRQTLHDVKVRERIDRKDMEELEREERSRPAVLGHHEDDLPTYTVEQYGQAIAYWKAISVLGRQQLEEKITEEAGGRSGTKKLSAFVEKRMMETMTAKSEAELDALQRKVAVILDKPGEEIDVDYWEIVRQKLPLFKAIAVVRLVRKKALERAKVAESIEALLSEHRKGAMETTVMAEYSDAESGCYSPVRRGSQDPLADDEELAGLSEYDELEQEENPNEWNVDEDDEAELEEKIPKPLPRIEKEEDDGDMIFEKFVTREKELSPEDEVILEADEVEVPNETGGVCKKPRYFNRIRTGFEWNRYNQTHYDQENPPPRIVQGYKFCINYPALQGLGRTPTWRLLPSDKNDDAVVIRFSAGPPYADVAFKIVNREWDIHPKRGYKNAFDRGILQLQFNFKRLRYRK